MLELVNLNKNTFKMKYLASGQFSKSNNYTIIVGKNGTGKSRLLRAIIEELTKTIDPEIKFEKIEGRNTNKAHNLTIQYEFLPEKIICVSTNPFDKFPILRNNNKNMGFYTYLGVRGIASTNTGLSYMQRIIKSLIETISTSPDRLPAILGVLDYLNYSQQMDLKFVPGPSFQFIKKILQEPDPLSNSIYHFKSIYTNKNFKVPFPIPEVNIQEWNRALNLCLMMRDNRYNIDLSLGHDRIDFQGNLDMHLYDLIFLLNSGFMKLADVSIIKRKSKQKFKINDASSGEQSVVLALLGVASHIQDKSLICIDEPEVCLHPEWQERYIQLLYTTFDNYKDCHFLIATHSPQIVSNLPNDNCCVMFMESGEAKISRAFTQKSSDFQLATVFNAPGHRNEYLSRTAINIFTKISEKKKLNEQDNDEFQLLLKTLPFLNTTDPVYQLTVALRDFIQSKND